MAARNIVAIGGSDAGISAALRARELDPTTEFTVVVADAYPNFSICGIPYYVSGEVTHWGIVKLFEPPVSLRVTPRRRENGVGLPADADVFLGA